MPYKTVWVAPEKFLTRKGVTVYRTYKEDEIDQGRRTFWFVTDPCEGEDMAFDVRDLRGWKRNGPLPIVPIRAIPYEEEKHIRSVIRAAIDSGKITEEGLQ